MKKHFKKLLALTATLMLVVLTLVPFTGLAERPEGNIGVKNDVRITKEFKAPEGVTLPNDVKFAFSVTKVGFIPWGVGEDQIDKTQETINSMPAISAADITFNAEDMAKGTTAEGIVTVNKQGNNLLAEVLAANSFPKAGIYRYEVKENQNTVAIGNGEEMNYDQGTYYLEVITSIDVETGEIITDGGIVWIDNGEKKDPSPQIKPGETIPTEEENVVVEKANDFVFKNRYKKDAGVDGDGNALTISKTITGDGADITKQFRFTLKIPANASTAGQTLTYTKYNEAGTVVGTADSPITLGDAGTAFTLGQNEKIAVKGAQVGTSFTVTEEKDTYMVSNITTINGIPTENTDDNTAATSTGKLGEKTNSVAYTNNLDKDIPTGIILNNLPYILLVAAALGGIVLFVASRRRDYSEE